MARWEMVPDFRPDRSARRGVPAFPPMCMASSLFLSRPVLVACAAAAALACSPTFNWRDSPVDGQLTALMPCKPDHAERRLPLSPDGAQATIVMAGCPAGGATFAVAFWPGLTPGEARTALQAWQGATRAQWRGAREEVGTATVLRAADAPAPEHWRLERPQEGAGDAGEGPGQIRWFAKADAKGVLTLYQATVLGRPQAPDAAQTFFDGLRLR